METVRFIVRNSGDPHFLLELVYTLCKIRGSKTIVKFFPHEVSDLEPVFYYLSNLTEGTLWQSHYSLLIWLSIIVMVPFDLETIDSNGDLVKRFLDLGKKFLEHTGRPRDAAGMMIAKLLTRPDILRKGYLEEFIDWSVTIIKSAQEFFKLGVLFTGVEIFTHGQRSELLPYLTKMSALLHKEENENMFSRQLKVKLAGRLALIQLKPIVASWRYFRGSRSLAANIEAKSRQTKIITNAQAHTLKARTQAQENDDSSMDADVDYELLEGQIDAILQGLRDRDNVVRWSAAKAIGRITGRLDKELGDEIVPQILELFSPTETDSAWHGGCLALGELARRGLLLPNRLDQVFPLLYQALLYDKKQGNHSIGAHVRDAACYLAWSFARAYAPEEMSKHLSELARHLLLVCLFDREINCRRAASAAFQEHVGRQGSFAHGIEILTEADYFTLGNRNHAYLHVSCFVAQYPEYLHSLVDHLVEVKLKHWDIIIRQLAACSLSVLVPFDPNYYIQVVIPKLLPEVYDNNLITRHGAILGVGEIIVGLAGRSALNNDPKTIEKMMYKHSVNYYMLKSSEEALDGDKAILKDSENSRVFKEYYKKLQGVSHLDLIPTQLFNQVKEIVPTIEKKRLYRGKGGQIIRISVSRFCECLAKSSIVLSGNLIIKIQETLNESVMHNAPEVSDAAQAGLSEFSKAYHNSPGTQLVEITLKKYLKTMQEFNSNKEIPANIARGSASGIGCLNFTLICTMPKEAIFALIEATKIRGTELDDPETRRNAASALGQLVSFMILNSKTPNPGNVRFEDELPIHEFDNELVNLVFDCLYSCTEDYTNDKRGDVGSWVRGAAIQSLQMIVSTGIAISEPAWEKIICVLLRQLVEKIDRLRQLAGDIITNLLQNYTLPAWSQVLLPLFVYNQEYMQQFKETQEKLQKTESLPDQSEMPIQSITSNYERSSLWSVPSFAFPLVVPLLDESRFRRDMIRGIIISVGGITESTVKSSSEELVKYVKRNKEIVWDLLNIFKEAEERLQIPFMKTWSLLFKHIPSINEMSEFGHQLLIVTQESIKTSKDIHKWLNSLGVFTALLDNPQCSREALRIMVGALGQAYPKVRAQAAQNLYSFFLGIDSHHAFCSSEDAFNKMVDMIINTSWILSLKEVRPVRNEIFLLLGMEPPKVKVTVKKDEDSKEQEDESYKSLVREMGY
mmetsp:Transcript_4041/g.3867  ORF Transcript_4041/g.3867 Transcript_4041/m.3867 type:complete len:1193 (-) Transcript_4041:55-3633(-)